MAPKNDDAPKKSRQDTRPAKRQALGDGDIPRIYFSRWDERSKDAYIRAASKNLSELETEYDRRNARHNTFMIVNGTVLGLVLAFMVNSRMLEQEGLKWIGAIMIVGFAFLLISFIQSVWTSAGGKDAPVMDFWVATNPQTWDVIDDPDLLEEDLMNGFLMRCVELKDTLEREIDRISLSSRVFSVGLVILMVSAILTLMFATA